MLAQAAFEELNAWSQSWFKNKDDQATLRKKKQERLGDILIDGLSQLRGSGLKLSLIHI